MNYSALIFTSKLDGHPETSFYNKDFTQNTIKQVLMEYNIKLQYHIALGQLNNINSAQ